MYCGEQYVSGGLHIPFETTYKPKSPRFPKDWLDEPEDAATFARRDEKVRRRALEHRHAAGGAIPERDARNERSGGRTLFAGWGCQGRVKGSEAKARGFEGIETYGADDHHLLSLQLWRGRLAIASLHGASRRLGCMIDTLSEKASKTRASSLSGHFLRHMDSHSKIEGARSCP